MNIHNSPSALTKLASPFFVVVMVVLVATTLHADSPYVEYVDNGRGPVPLHIPSTYNSMEPLPLIVALHGFMQEGADVEEMFDFVDQIESKRFLYALPDGSRNILGQGFWNATDACCDFFGSDIDDSTYLRELVDLIRSQYAVDDLSIHFIGYSNGGFMSHRMAIDHSDQVASILSLAGANYFDAGAHVPEYPVHVLQVHGTADDDIRYEGGSLVGIPYPGAIQTQLNWAAYNGLQPDAQQVGKPFDLDILVAGNETTRQIFDLGNSKGIKVELWTMKGTDHFPFFDEGNANLFAQRGVDWLLSHRKTIVVPVIPDSMLVTRGIHVSGGVLELAESDNADLSLQRAPADVQSRTEFEVRAVSPVPAPLSLEVTLEGSVFARTPVIQTIELYDYTAGAWEPVDTRAATRFSDSTVAVAATGDLSRFVESGVGPMNIQARIRFQSANPRQRFSSNTDQFIWMIGK